MICMSELKDQQPDSPPPPDPPERQSPGSDSSGKQSSKSADDVLPEAYSGGPDKTGAAGAERSEHPMGGGDKDRAAAQLEAEPLPAGGAHADSEVARTARTDHVAQHPAAGDTSFRPHSEETRPVSTATQTNELSGGAEAKDSSPDAHGQVRDAEGILDPSDRWKPEDGTPVLGRSWDADVAKEWSDHKVLDLKDWNLERNDQWVDSIIEQEGEPYLASPQESNRWDIANDRQTVYGRELAQFERAGYHQEGDYLRSPEERQT